MSLLFILTACAENSYEDYGSAAQNNWYCEHFGYAPEISIAQAYHDALRALEYGERVLLILLDGWGWEMFQYFEDRQPFLSSLNPVPALAAYPPLTPVGLATIITGVQPDVHGIQSRNDRRMNDGVEDIFAAAQRLGRNAVYIQGASNPIQTSLLPIFSPDRDEFYGTDNSVFANAQRNLDADFLFVHFKGIDDTAHTYGPYADEVGARMALIDGYVSYLAERWGSGTVIITADHGMHRVYDNPDRLGDHFTNCHEDMIVPYAIISMESNARTPSDGFTFMLTAGGQTHTVTMDDLLSIGAVGVSSSPRGVLRNFTGVPLAGIFDYFNIDYSDAGAVAFTSLDGFTAAVSIAEALDANNVFIVFEENDEPLGTMGEGGRGPYMVVVALDMFANRWARYLMEVIVQ